MLQKSCCHLAWILIIGLGINRGQALEHESEIETTSYNDDNGYDIDSLYDFLAARGRRESNDDDLFWANRMVDDPRGKRSNIHDIKTRNAVSNHVKPNGFLFVMGKKNALKPNSFNFLLTGKRSGMPRPNSFLFPVKREGQSMMNSLRPNGFLFPHGNMGKRDPDYQIDENPYFGVPKPTSIFWPSFGGKRDDAKTSWQNRIRPTGFLFSMQKGKKSDEPSEEVETDEEDMKRSALDMSFFAGRGRRSVRNRDLNSFFAGRGKRADVGHDTKVEELNEVRPDEHDDHDEADSDDSFFAGRGKKAD